MSQLPYLASPGNVSKALTAIQSAATPARVTQDFVKSILKIPGSSGDQMTTFLKRLGFAGSDGAPTDLYRRFRNPVTAGAAMASAVQTAYSELYKHNEYAHALDDKELKGLIVQISGQSSDSRPVGLVLSTFRNLQEFCDFEARPDAYFEEEEPETKRVPETRGEYTLPLPAQTQKLGLNLGSTINLNLPPTSDIEVFNAIFKSIKENLLKDE